MFRPKKYSHLGAIVIKKNNRLLTSDFLTEYPIDQYATWRINDDGLFFANKFRLNTIFKTNEGATNFVIEWDGLLAKNIFALVDRSGRLDKEFKRHDLK